MRDLYDELENWEGWPEAWRPDVGDILVGTIESYNRGLSAYGPVWTVIVREERKDQRVSVWLSSTVLLALFRQQRPKVGERIGLKYEGKDQGKGYRRYHLIVDRENESLDFEKLGGEDFDFDEAG